MASLIYNAAKTNFINGTHNWTSGSQTYKILLVNSGYTVNPDHTFVSDTTPGTNELSGTGYTGGFGGSGRKALTSRTATTNLAADRCEATAANITWTAISAGTIAAAIIYRENTSDSDSALIAFIDTPDVTTNGGDFTIQWASNGIFNLT